MNATSPGTQPNQGTGPQGPANQPGQDPFEVLNVPLDWAMRKVTQIFELEDPVECNLGDLCKTEKGYLGQTVHICKAQPSSASRISNYKDDTRAFYLNGVAANVNDIEVQGQKAADIHGRDTRVILNNQAPLPVVDQFAALIGLLSADGGRAIEPMSTMNVVNGVQEAVKEGKKARLVCFSQGAIIVSNALEGMKRRTSPEEWEKISSAVEVVALGCPIQRWPTGIEVLSCAFESDKAASLGRAISEGPSRATLGGAKRVTAVTISANRLSLSHEAVEYMNELPRFLVAAEADEKGNINGSKMAGTFVRSVRSGTWSNNVHDSIVYEMVKNQNREFAQAIVGAFPDGKIGEYPVPLMGELMKLAPAKP